MYLAMAVGAVVAGDGKAVAVAVAAAVAPYVLLECKLHVAAGVEVVEEEVVEAAVEVGVVVLHVFLGYRRLEEVVEVADVGMGVEDGHDLQERHDVWSPTHR